MTASTTLERNQYIVHRMFVGCLWTVSLGIHRVPYEVIGTLLGWSVPIFKQWHKSQQWNAQRQSHKTFSLLWWKTFLSFFSFLLFSAAAEDMESDSRSRCRLLASSSSSSFRPPTSSFDSKVVVLDWKCRQIFLRLRGLVGCQSWAWSDWPCQPHRREEMDQDRPQVGLIHVYRFPVSDDVELSSSSILCGRAVVAVSAASAAAAVAVAALEVKLPNNLCRWKQKIPSYYIHTD